MSRHAARLHKLEQRARRCAPPRRLFSDNELVRRIQELVNYQGNDPDTLDRRRRLLDRLIIINRRAGIFPPGRLEELRGGR